MEHGAARKYTRKKKNNMPYTLTCMSCYTNTHTSNVLDMEDGAARKDKQEISISQIHVYMDVISHAHSKHSNNTSCRRTLKTQ